MSVGKQAHSLANSPIHCVTLTRPLSTPEGRAHPRRTVSATRFVLCTKKKRMFVCLVDLVLVATARHGRHCRHGSRWSRARLRPSAPTAGPVTATAWLLMVPLRFDAPISFFCSLGCATRYVPGICSVKCVRGFCKQFGHYGATRRMEYGLLL
jgi:hypothetical protein